MAGLQPRSSGPDVATYEFVRGVETLRDLPRLLPGRSTDDGEAVAIRIPGEGTTAATSGPPLLRHEVTYRDLRGLVGQVATALVRTAGVSLGDVVAIAMPNNVECVLSLLAVPWVRAVSAPLNPDYTENEFAYYMEDNKSKCLLVPGGENGGGGGIPEAEAAAARLGLPVYAVTWNADAVTATLTLKGGDGAGMPPAAEEEGPELTFEPHPDDVALFLHTSGTTARPKGVPLTHANMVASINNISTTYRLTPDDAVLLVMPLFHIHGLMSALFSTLATGGCVILPPQPKFSAGAFWHNAAAGGATWVTCVPTIYQVLLLRHGKDHPGEDAAPRFRFVRSCSSALAPSVLAEIEEKFRAPCVEAYAMTEAAHQMTSNPLDGPRKPGTVGRGTGVDVAILDGGNNVVTDPDVEGEVCIRGRNVTGGYIGVSDEVNVEAFAGGWFHTGDQGKIDADGYLQLTGRIKELINRAGEKISPLEVDAAMLSHPAVAEAVSFSIPHDIYGEVVGAAIVLKEGQDLDEQGLKDFLVDKLSTFKIPTKVFFDTTLPKTPTGKIQRRFVAAHFLK